MSSGSNTSVYLNIANVWWNVRGGSVSKEDVRGVLSLLRNPLQTSLQILSELINLYTPEIIKTAYY